MEHFMKEINKQSGKQSPLISGKSRSYAEVVEFLDTNWAAKSSSKKFSCMKKLNQAFNNVAKKIRTVLVNGTNGKSLTINFASQLLQAEKLTVGTFYAPHIMMYNERISINNETISNKVFTELANEVLTTAQTEGIEPTSHEVLTMIALLYFDKNNVGAALLEVNEGGVYDATNVCDATIAAITRVTEDDESKTAETLKAMLGIVKNGTHVVSADQSKANLQTMVQVTEEKNGQWSMPIRKLAQLKYPFEQLHGRSAALAERIAYTFVNDVLKKDSVATSGTLLSKQKGQRGRPTLEAKRASELNPRKTVEQFWRETTSTLTGRFQLLEKEKPSVLLDNASNLDSFKNLLLGIRLLHYRRPIKGLVLIVGNDNPSLDHTEFLKLLRYFFKKTSGQVIFSPVKTIAGDKGSKSWNVEKLTNDAKSMKIKARSSKSFKEAFGNAQKIVDERYGLVAVAGCTSILADYWNYKGIKKV